MKTRGRSAGVLDAVNAGAPPPRGEPLKKRLRQAQSEEARLAEPTLQAESAHSPLLPLPRPPCSQLQRSSVR
jgi:hypothetical protein